MSVRPWIAGSAGIALAALLVWQAGTSSVSDAVAAAGWQAVLAVAALHLLAQAVCAVAWWVLCLPGSTPAAGRPACTRRACARPACARFVAVRLVRDAMGEVLPAVPAGELAAVRELVRAGLGTVEASALTIADVTLELAGQAGFSLASFGLVTLAGPDAGPDAWRLPGLSGVAASLLLLAGCLWVQHSGGRHLARLCGGAMPLLRGVPQVWERLHGALRRIYRRRGAVALAAAIHLGAWVVGGLQAWAVLRIMGVPVTLAGALALEAFVSSVRRVAPTPGAVGVQEGGYVLAGAALGIGESAALALSLVKRARDLLVALPVVLAWQAVQVRRARRLAYGQAVS